MGDRGSSVVASPVSNNVMHCALARRTIWLAREGAVCVGGTSYLLLLWWCTTWSCKIASAAASCHSPLLEGILTCHFWHIWPDLLGVRWIEVSRLIRFQSAASGHFCQSACDSTRKRIHSSFSSHQNDMHHFTGRVQAPKICELTFSTLNPQQQNNQDSCSLGKNTHLSKKRPQFKSSLLHAPTGICSHAP